MNQGANQGDDSAGQRNGATERIVHMQIIAGETERVRGGQPDGGTDEEEMRAEMHEKEESKDKRSVQTKMSKQLQNIWSQSCAMWVEFVCWAL